MKISVDADALREVLQALNSSGPELRELQATRNPILDKVRGGENPINKLIREFNEQIEAVQHDQQTD